MSKNKKILKMGVSCGLRKELFFTTANGLLFIKFRLRI
jgi:hypothetical protein